MLVPVCGDVVLHAGGDGVLVCIVEWLSCGFVGVKTITLSVIDLFISFYIEVRSLGAIGLMKWITLISASVTSSKSRFSDTSCNVWFSVASSSSGFSPSFLCSSLSFSGQKSSVEAKG